MYKSIISSSKSFIAISLTTLCLSCASVSYLDKHGNRGSVKELTESTYSISNEKSDLLKKCTYTFTKNGRVDTSECFGNSNNLLVNTEKKLWFEKQSFLDKEPYYCKTRWKPRQRERISCYTQKQYKQNESIYYYHKDGRIDKVEENFTSFNTSYYHYSSSKELKSITIKDKTGSLIDSILVTCKSKDQFNNCTQLEKRYTILDSLIVIKRDFTY